MQGERPTRCIVCNYRGAIVRAGFNQLYKQHQVPPVVVPWWECPNCGSWFGSPRPTIEEIKCNWAQTEYNNPEEEAYFATFKIESQNKILDAIEKIRPNKGALLDYGSNFGHFLDMARDRGWSAVGADAFEKGVAATREKGFQTFLAWELEDLDLPNSSLDAYVSNDVFYYVWDPYRHLQKAYDLLKPGGAFVVRTSNKLAIETFLRRIISAGDKRNKVMSGYLQGQFHSIQVNTLAKVMTQIGFKVHSTVGAMTAPPQEYSKKTIAMYKMADVLHWLTGGGINVSPGVMIVAEKR